MTNRIITLLIFVVVFTLSGNAQQTDEKVNPRENQYIFWGYPDNYLENQARVTFEKINEILIDFPPTIEKSLPREMTLIALDNMLHDVRNDKSETFYHFVNTRISLMIKEMQKPVKKGVKVFKLYNDGFILKTKTTTIAIDLVPGGPESRPFIDDSLIYQIANQCDAMFVTHAHGDHANLRIAKAFAESGKKVVVPKDLWTDVHENIQQLMSENKDVTVSFDEHGFDVRILPGHQDEMYNNIYIFNFKNGISIAHTGDQYNKDDVEWISKIKNDNEIDALLVNCWINCMDKSIAGFDPKIVITGHENEMEHSIDHREAYWMTMCKMKKTDYPNVLMTWGEYYWIKH